MKRAIIFLLLFSIGFSWWDMNYQYRREILISNPSGTTRTNEPIYVSVDSNGHAKSDCSDYRIVDENDVEVPSKILNCTNGNGYIMFNFNASGSSAKYYVYYGNPSVTQPIYNYSYSTSSAFVLFAKNDGSFGKFDDCYDSPQIVSNAFYGEAMMVSDVRGRQIHAGTDGSASNACRLHPFQTAYFKVDDYPIMSIAIKAAPGTQTCLFHYMCYYPTSSCSWFVTGCTPSGNKGGYAWAPNYFTIIDDNKWHIYTYDLRQIGRPYQNTFEFWVYYGTGAHTYYFDQMVFQKEFSYTLGSEERGSICGANGCEPGENYTNCPQDCCLSDCTAGDNVYHSECNGYNGCSINPLCDGLSVNSKLCKDATTILTCPNTLTSCSSGLYCNNGQCSSCSSVCDGVCSGVGAACYGTDPDCDSSGNPTLACCGNSKCEGAAGESCSTCPQDCGVCPEGCNPDTCKGSCGTCKEYKCEGDACVCSTILNCCGNGICEAGESYINCSLDCGPSSISVNFIEPSINSEYVRGENVLVKVNVSYNENAPGTNANVSLVLPFASYQMIELGGGLYQSNFTIPANISGILEIIVNAKKGISSSASRTIFVNNSLNLDLNYTHSLFKTQDLVINGFVKDAKGRPINGTAIISFNNKEYLSSINNGVFNYTYYTSMLDKSGLWSIDIYVNDSFNNSASKKITVNVSTPNEGEYLQINLTSPSGYTFKRGEKIKVEVLTSSGANVKVKTFSGEYQKLDEVSPGKYYTELQVPFDAPLGDWDLEVIAEKGPLSGVVHKNINVEPAKIILSISKKQSVSKGENVNIIIKATYDNGLPVEEEQITATINNKTVNLTRVSQGTYSYSFIANENTSVLDISLSDEANNTGSASISISVAGVSLSYLYMRYWYITIPSTGAAAYAIFFFLKKFLFKLSYNAVLLKKKQLLKRKKALQKDYFVKHTISSKFYEKQISQINEELSVIKKRLKKFKKKKH